MYKKGAYKVGVILAVVIAAGGMLFGNAMGQEAFSGPKVKSKEIAVFEVNAPVESVDRLNAMVLVAEKQFMVANFMVDGKLFKTELTGEKGNTVKLDAVTAGQRVYVRGFKYMDDVHIAHVIQIVSSDSVDKDFRTIDRMKPVDATE